MSKENLVKLMQAAAKDEQLKAQLEQTDSYEGVKNLARKQGFNLGDLSAEEAKRTVGVATGEISDELSDEELELVAGGFEEVKVTFKRFKGLIGDDIGIL